MILTDNQQTSFLAEHPILLGLLIETDVIEEWSESETTMIVTEVGTVEIKNRIARIKITEPYPEVRGVSDDSLLYPSMVAFELARLNLIATALTFERDL